MKQENKRGYDDVDADVGCKGDAMSFSEIGERLGITEIQAKRIFESAMRKLKKPGFNRKLWEYMNLGDFPQEDSDLSSDNYF